MREEEPLAPLMRLDDLDDTISEERFEDAKRLTEQYDAYANLLDHAVSGLSLGQAGLISELRKFLGVVTGGCAG